MIYFHWIYLLLYAYETYDELMAAIKAAMD